MSRITRARIYPWYLTLLMCGGYAVSFLDRSVINAAGTPIKLDLGLSDSQFGLLNGTAFVLLYCLGTIQLGRLADRVDRRRMIALGILFWSAMTALCGLAGSLGLFMVGRIGVGLGEASLVPAGMSLIGSEVPRDRMGRAVAVFIMGATIGNAGALIGGGYLLSRLSPDGMLAPWRMLFLIAAVPGLLVAGLFMTLRERPRAEPASRSGIRAALVHVRAQPRAYGFLTLAACCNITIAQSQGAWATLFYVRHFGLVPSGSAMLVGLMFLTSAPTGQFVGGLICDRLQARGVPAAQNLVMAIALALALVPGAIFCTSDQLGLSEAAYSIFVFLVSAATPCSLAGLQMLMPAPHRGMLSALFLAIVTLVGLGFGPPAVGLLTDHLFHDERRLGLSLLIVILVAGIAGPLLALAGRKPFAEAAEAADPSRKASGQ